MRNLFLLAAIVPFSLLAQPSIPPAEDQTVAPDAEIYNGKMHMDYLPAVSGIAYYLSDAWQPGTIMYHDIFYPSVWMKYDLVRKLVIVRHFNGVTPVVLFSPRIRYFSISGKNFIQVKETDTLGLPPGLYEEVQKGKMGLYILRSKELLETPVRLEIERSFLEKNSYYIVTNGIGFKIKNQKDINGLVKNKKTLIKTQLKKKGLKFKSSPEAVLTEIVTYYNENNN